MEAKLAETAPRRPLAVTVGAVLFTLVVVFAVMAGPSVMECFGTANAGQCIRGKIDGMTGATTGQAVAIADTEQDVVPPEAQAIEAPAPDIAEPEAVAALEEPAAVETPADPQVEPVAPADVEAAAPHEDVAVVEPEDAAIEAAPVEPVPEVAEPQAVEPETVLPEAEPVVAAIAPQLGLVRAEPDGSLVIAGSAEPGAEVAVLANGEVIGTTVAEDSGDWVIVPEARLAPGGAELTVEIPATQMASADSVVVVINEDLSSEPLVVASTPGEASQILQGLTREEPAEMAAIEEPAVETPLVTPPEAPEAPAEDPVPADEAEVATAEPEVVIEPEAAVEDSAPEELALAEPDVTPPVSSVAPSIDAIEIDGDRNFFAGGGEEGTTVRLYVNDVFIADSVVEGGRWLVESNAVLVYPAQRVRIDVLQPGTADVTARAEVNFVIDLPAEIQPEEPAVIETPQTAVAEVEPEVPPDTPAEPAVTDEPVEMAIADEQVAPAIAEPDAVEPPADVVEEPAVPVSEPETVVADGPVADAVEPPAVVVEPVTPAAEASAAEPAVPLEQPVLAEESVPAEAVISLTPFEANVAGPAAPVPDEGPVVEADPEPVAPDVIVPAEPEPVIERPVAVEPEPGLTIAPEEAAPVVPDESVTAEANISPEQADPVEAPAAPEPTEAPVETAVDEPASLDPVEPIQLVPFQANAVAEAAVEPEAVPEAVERELVVPEVAEPEAVDAEVAEPEVEVAPEVISPRVEDAPVAPEVEAGQEQAVADAVGQQAEVAVEAEPVVEPEVVIEAVPETEPAPPAEEVVPPVDAAPEVPDVAPVAEPEGVVPEPEPVVVPEVVVPEANPVVVEPEVAEPVVEPLPSAEVTAPVVEPAPAAEVTEPAIDPSIPTLVAVPVGDPELQRFASGRAIIRRGDNLWTIARRVYGEGIRYTTIFEANSEQIRDPDQIYPGQVFDLPAVENTP